MGVTVETQQRTGARASRMERWMFRLAATSLGVNVLIVLTGGVVRLTASGLGCPTWPRCTDESFVPHGELGLHGAIEFGNRLVTFLLAAVAIATYVTARRYGRRPLIRLALQEWDTHRREKLADLTDEERLTAERERWFEVWYRRQQLKERFENERPRNG